MYSILVELELFAALPASPLDHNARYDFGLPMTLRKPSVIRLIASQSVAQGISQSSDIGIVLGFPP